MFDVVVYLSSLKDQRPSRKSEVLLAFAEGARRHGANVHVETEYVHRPARLAVILGWPSPEQRGANIQLRQTVVQEQKRLNCYTMAIDAGCFKFHDPDSRYLRYSINGVFYDRSEYANKNSDPNRWQIISKQLNLKIKPWRTTTAANQHFLFLLQRDGGWSMKGMNPIKWTKEKLKILKSLTDAPIVLRPHPGKVSDVSEFADRQVRISDSKSVSLIDDLHNARAAFVFNSSSGVAAILHGIPLFVDDLSSVAWAVANHNIAKFQDPTFPDRTQWIQDLAAAHWSDEESRQGLVYQKFLPFLN